MLAHWVTWASRVENRFHLLLFSWFNFFISRTLDSILDNRDSIQLVAVVASCIQKMALDSFKSLALKLKGLHTSQELRQELILEATNSMSTPAPPP